MDSKAIAGSVQKAKEAGIPVVAYDRLAEGPIAAYTSFDNEEVGKAQGEALLKAMGAKATKTGKIVMINGAITDPNAAYFKKGAHSVLDGKVNIGKEYDTPEWDGRRTPTPRWRPPSPRSARTRSPASTPPTTAWRAASSPPSSPRA